MSNNELNSILEAHRKYLAGENGGRYADLRNANLSYADLSYADLRGANLIGADLSCANLIGADLMNANLRMAVNMDKMLWDSRTKFYSMQCPEEGAFIGWKKAHNQIVKLEICADALRSSATSRKCRCSSAKVLAIENIDGSKYGDVITSNYDPSFLYKVGEIVKVENFDTDRWKECAPGIHFFLTREEAVKYCC